MAPDVHYLVVDLNDCVVLSADGDRPPNIFASPLMSSHFAGRRQDYQDFEATPALRAIEAEGSELAELIQLAMESGCPIWLRATGESMAPAIRHGTNVRLIPPQRCRPRRGDVVLARFPTGKLVLHRVEAVNGRSLTLRGDNHVNRDPVIGGESVLGVVDLVESDGKLRDVGSLPQPSLYVRWRRLVRPIRDVLRSWRAARSRT